MNNKNYGDHFIHDDESDYTDINQYIAPPIVPDNRKPLIKAPEAFKPPKKQSNAPLAAIAIILFLLVAGGGAYLYFFTPYLDELKPNSSKAYNASKSSSAAETVADNGADGYLNGSVYIWDNKAFEMFYGSEAAAKNYAQAISSYKKKLGNAITVYNMVVPNHSEFGLPARLRDSLCESQRKNMDTIFANYTEDIKSIDIYSSMQNHINEYIFFDTDHHWTAKGAYYGYLDFASAAGLSAMNLENSTRSYIDGFLGSLYTLTEDPILAQYPDRVDYYSIDGNFDVSITDKDGSTAEKSLYYDDAQPGSNTYGVFLWGDNPYTKIINSNSTTKRKLAVVKESYGNAIVPYLAYNYSEVDVIDFRYYSGNLKQLCEQNGITEVLFINGIMSANTVLQVEKMENLFN